mgnify:CR=1 FL=1
MTGNWAMIAPTPGIKPVVGMPCTLVPRSFHEVMLLTAQNITDLAAYYSTDFDIDTRKSVREAQICFLKWMVGMIPFHIMD